jgi:hypothetical protein
MFWYILNKFFLEKRCFFDQSSKKKIEESLLKSFLTQLIFSCLLHRKKNKGKSEKSWN